MRIVLVAVNIKNGYSLALGYIASFLLSKEIGNKIDLKIRNISLGINSEKENLIKFIKEYKPDIVGLSCYIWNFKETLNLCKEIKNHLSETKIVLGGPQVTPLASETLIKNPSVDIVVRGEGEITFYEIINHLIECKNDFSDILGITYRNKEKIIVNESRPLIENLDDIPSPYLTKVLDIDDLIENQKIILIETSRGCIFNCAYCYWNKNYKKIRYFSLERAKEELEFIFKNNKIKIIEFLDGVINADKLRFKKLSEILHTIISDTKFDVKTKVQIDAELLDKDTIDNLKKLKPIQIECGLQTTNQKSLKAIHRKFNSKIFANNIKALKENDVLISIDLIAGLPEDNLRSFIKSLKYAFELQPSDITVNWLSLLPGTELYDKCDKYNYIIDEENYNVTISNNTFSKDDMKIANENLLINEFEINKFSILFKIDPKIFSLHNIYKTVNDFSDKAYFEVYGNPKELIKLHIKPKDKKVDLNKLALDFNNELINSQIYSFNLLTEKVWVLER